MKTFRIVGIIILLMIVALFIGAFFLPATVDVSKSVSMKASKQTVYSLVADFHRWNEWAPWKDSKGPVTITGAGQGKGAVMRWKNKKDMVGEREIVRADADTIEVLTTFREEHSSALMTFAFKQSNDSTRVSLHMKMDNTFSYPFGRYVAWMIFAGSEMSFQNALDSLKKAAEREEKINLGYHIEEENFPAGDYLAAKDSCTMDRMELTLADLFTKISQVAAKKGVEFTGAPLVFWTHFNPQAYSKFIAAIPVAEIDFGMDKGEVQYFHYQGSKVCKIAYHGSYEESDKAWTALQNYMLSKGYQLNGAPFEEYVTGPKTEPDTAKWLTNIYFPVDR